MHGDSMKIKIRLWVKITLTIITIFTFLFIYGRYINTRGYKVNEYTIIDNIPNSFNGLKIVHISDINYLHTTNNNDLKKIINRINLINPDIVVFTGDLLNINIKYSNKDQKKLTNLLSNIKANIGKLAIKGEEDKKNEDVETILKNSNFTILDNTYEYIYNKTKDPIVIAGISNTSSNIDDFDENLYSILLIHKPDDIEKIDYKKYNLILSGHSINGYINIPGIKNLLLEKGCEKYYENYYKIDNTLLYISNGIGTKNIKFRLFNKPSINLYRINNKNIK